jgi:hypothetical protein
MSLIVAARFTTFDDAGSAVGSLRSKGFVDEDVSVFYVNPGGQHARYPMGGDRFVDPEAREVSRGAALGAVLGAVLGVALAAGLTLLVSNSLPMLAIAVGVGAYVGSLAGGMWKAHGGGRDIPLDCAHEPDGTLNTTRESGVLLAVHVSPETSVKAEEALRAAGGQEIERASGRWQDGRWADFDPTRTIEPVSPLDG